MLCIDKQGQNENVDTLEGLVCGPKSKLRMIGNVSLLAPYYGEYIGQAEPLILEYEIF